MDFMRDKQTGLTNLFSEKMAEPLSPVTYQSTQIGDPYNKEEAFLPFYLSRQIGKWMKVEMLLGNDLHAVVGQLLKVGPGYLVLKQNTNPVSTVICNMSGVHLITILYGSKPKESDKSQKA